MDLLDAALLALAVPLVLAALFATRVLLLTRSRGFDCSWRPLDGGGGRWALGVARVTHDAVEWWRVLSLSPRPRSTWRRGALQVTASRDADPGGVPGLLAGSLVVRCAQRGGSARGFQGTDGTDGAVFELAMTRDAYTGFASWLESAPPRDRGGVT